MYSKLQFDNCTLKVLYTNITDILSIEKINQNYGITLHNFSKHKNFIDQVIDMKVYNNEVWTYTLKYDSTTRFVINNTCFMFDVLDENKFKLFGESLHSEYMKYNVIILRNLFKDILMYLDYKNNNNNHSYLEKHFDDIEITENYFWDDDPY